VNEAYDEKLSLNSEATIVCRRTSSMCMGGPLGWVVFDVLRGAIYQARCEIEPRR